MDGRIVRQWPLIGVEGSFSVDLSNLTVGTYVVQIGNESQLVYPRSLMDRPLNKCASGVF